MQLRQSAQEEPNSSVIQKAFYQTQQRFHVAIKEIIDPCSKQEFLSLLKPSEIRDLEKYLEPYETLMLNPFENISEKSFGNPYSYKQLLVNALNTQEFNQMIKACITAINDKENFQAFIHHIKRKNSFKENHSNEKLFKDENTLTDQPRKYLSHFVKQLSALSHIGTETLLGDTIENNYNKFLDRQIQNCINQLEKQILELKELSEKNDSHQVSYLSKFQALWKSFRVRLSDIFDILMGDRANLIRRFTKNLQAQLKTAIALNKYQEAIKPTSTSHVLSLLLKYQQPAARKSKHIELSSSHDVDVSFMKASEDELLDAILGCKAEASIDPLHNIQNYLVSQKNILLKEQQNIQSQITPSNKSSNNNEELQRQSKQLERKIGAIEKIAHSPLLTKDFLEKKCKKLMKKEESLKKLVLEKQASFRPQAELSFYGTRISQLHLRIEKINTILKAFDEQAQQVDKPSQENRDMPDQLNLSA